MNRLDPDAIKRVSGPAWAKLKPDFMAMSETLLSVADDAVAELTTIYVKFEVPRDAMKVYAVAWLKRSSEIVVGLALPEGISDPALFPPPADRKYAGLTAFFRVDEQQRVPSQLAEWARQAHANVTT